MFSVAFPWSIPTSFWNAQGCQPITLCYTCLCPYPRLCQAHILWPGAGFTVVPSSTAPSPCSAFSKSLCVCRHCPSCPEGPFSTLLLLPGPAPRSFLLSLSQVPLSGCAWPQAPEPALSSLLCQNTCLLSMALSLFMRLSVCPWSREPQGRALSDSWPSLESGQHQGACAKQH